MNLTVSLVVVQLLSHVQLFCDPITGQAPLSMGFSRQEYWSGLPFPSPGDLPDPGIKPTSPANLLPCRQILYCWATRENPVYFVSYFHDVLPAHEHITYSRSWATREAQEQEWVAYCFSSGSSQLRNRPNSGIVPTQESNWSLLHCRQIVYQLNYQGSP